MVTVQDSAGQIAPGALEQVRELLNTWLIPNDSRVPDDRFGRLAGQRGWAGGDAVLLRELRDDLRRQVENGAADDDCLNRWIARLGLRPAVASGAMRYRHRGGPAGDALAAVLAAVGAGTWKRLKACPDCRWVFYDNTRNGSKRWCLMYAGGPEGRACGTIAKVRRYRDRQTAAAGHEGRPGLTERKPSSMSWTAWIDQQIDEAKERGSFDNLPGAGQPLPDRGDEDFGQAWLREYVRREGVPIEEMLPPPLKLRKQSELLARRVPGMGSEQDVRDAVTALNQEIMDWRRIPVGPPIFVPLVDEDKMVGLWRDARPATPPGSAAAEETGPGAAADRQHGPRPWWRRRRGGR